MRAAWIALLLLACLVAPSGAVAAEPAGAGYRVIVNRKNPAASVDRRFLVEAFLKKRTRWDDDRALQPVDLEAQSGVRDRFSRDALGRDSAAVRRYWAQLVFSGRGVPPPELADEAEVVKYVASHPGGIGYVSAGADLSGGAVRAIGVE